MIRLLLLLAAVSVMPFAAMAQEEAKPACTQIGCHSGVNFMVPEDYRWEDGRYTFQLALDQKTVTCVGELPLKPCDQGPSFRCDSKQVAVGEKGCEAPETLGRVTEIAVGGTPRKIVFRTALNGKTMLTRTLEPDYQVSQPNGPMCQPICRNAVYQLFK